jgi:hypothetical protein
LTTARSLATFGAIVVTGCGGDGEHNIRVASSTDLVDREMLPDALPALAGWSGLTPLFSDEPHTATWAPAAIALADR